MPCHTCQNFFVKFLSFYVIIKSQNILTYSHPTAHVFCIITSSARCYCSSHDLSLHKKITYHTWLSQCIGGFCVFACVCVLIQFPLYGLRTGLLPTYQLRYLMTRGYFKVVFLFPISLFFFEQPLLCSRLRFLFLFQFFLKGKPTAKKRLEQTLL